MQVFIDVPTEHRPATEKFWAAATGGTVPQPWSGHPEFVTLTPEAGAPYVHVQEIGGPPRVHIDLTTADVDAETSRLADLGAEPIERLPWWQSMTSPGGLPFCVCCDPARLRPEPVSWPAGHRSRVVQVSLDAPAASFSDELQFWAAATGWQTEPSARPEYESLVAPDTSPITLLLQRLGTNDPRVTTTAHIDLGSDDIDAEVDRLVAAGATNVEQHSDRERRHVLEDPAGLRFCVTGRSPD